MNKKNDIPAIKKYSWEELISYCVDIYTKMYRDDYIPDVIISIARGGFFTGLVMAHLFKTQELYSVGASTNISDNVRSERKYPEIESLFSELNIDRLIGKRILLVDDVFNTGYTLKAVYDYISKLNPQLRIRTACMIYDTYLDKNLSIADFNVNYYSDKRCAWAVFPWETIGLNEKIRF